MSLAGLVDYGSSDDSDNDDENKTVGKIVEQKIVTNEINYHLKDTKIVDSDEDENNVVVNSKEYRLETKTNGFESGTQVESSKTLLLDSLPKPKALEVDNEIVEEDDICPPIIAKHVPIEKPPKKEKAPVKISIPSLSDFNDLDDEKDNKKIRPQASKKLPGVLALLPPPKDELLSTSKLIPHVLSRPKPTTVKTSLTPIQIRNQAKERSQEKNMSNHHNNTKSKNSTLNSTKEDSDSDEDTNYDKSYTNKESNSIDFFSLSEPVNVSLADDIVTSNILRPEAEIEIDRTRVISEFTATNEQPDQDVSSDPEKTLTSTVMNLPKDEILMKNKAAIGPKLPVPEQEFNVDAEGNVAIDEKAIEYLCGKRGIKRKNQIINEANIIDINGEDIKPDEREWLVKALTEEPIQRPVSLGSGPSGQSKKKHQITYLAHQAKAMELELKNQWSANRLARRQTQSKYGFK